MTGSWTTIYGHGIMTVQTARNTMCIIFQHFSFCLSGTHFEHLTLTGCCVVEKLIAVHR